ncbi:T9SS type A sorting domain-containing protein [Chryseobacterium sp. SN22]|uniref:T9SS type A sorting domain-containing protein n=1 Tax=Chryseobacterium sp. SN22 TaxID=2606431 RepID=UPI0011ED70A0|nr:T9SS type A sorting domain-containing protein [Chryseobacterium sp. SN22]KAA0128607.1 T9SS type A sorting domain-containing protein [Chryseobacterium sp. SN22]
MNKHFYLLILGILLNFNWITAQTVTVSNNTLGQPAVYTFTYTTSQAIGTGTSTPNVFYLSMPSGYPAISPLVSGGSNLNPYVTFKVNGVAYPCTTSFGSGVGGSWASGIQLSTGGANPGISIPAGAEIQITVSGLITNPSSYGTYNFTWRTSQANGATVQNFSSPLNFSLAAAPTVTVNNNTLGQPSAYTFTYTTSQAIGTGTSVPNVFYLWLPSGYPSISPVVSGGSNLNSYVTFKVNGTAYPCSASFGSGVGGSWASGIQLSTGGANPGISIPAGAQVQIIVSGLITNPSSYGTYNFMWRIAQSNGASVQDYNVPLSFSSTLSTGETNKAKEQIKVYPNPSADYIQLSGISANEVYEIYNLAGQRISSGRISSNEKINIEKLVKGSYIIQVGFKTFNFIKK